MFGQGLGILIAYEENGIRVREVIVGGRQTGGDAGDLLTHIGGRRITVANEDFVSSCAVNRFHGKGDDPARWQTLRRDNQEIVALPSLPVRWSAMSP